MEMSLVDKTFCLSIHIKFYYDTSFVIDLTIQLLLITILSSFFGVIYTPRILNSCVLTRTKQLADVLLGNIGQVLQFYNKWNAAEK